MHRARRVGTLTAGIVLVLSGIVFLFRVVYPKIDFAAIISFWPVILIMLGIEVITAYIINQEEKITYDAGAIWLVAALSFFAMGMGGMEFLIKNMTRFSGLI